MALLLLCTVALLAGGLANPVENVHQKFADHEFLQHQVDILNLFYHIHEPIHEPQLQVVVESWDLFANLEHFNNHTAVKLYYDVVKNDMLLPRGVPFSVSEPTHIFEAKVLFDLFYSAKDFDTFYNAAVYLRNRVNEGLYVYVLSVVLLKRPDSRGIVVPPIYEIFPSFFHNAEIMSMAQRINTHGKRMLEQYPSTYVRDDNIVIRWNSTSFPYYNDNEPVTYYTHDVTLNALYYNVHVMSPFWLESETVPLKKDRRGEVFLFYYSQFLARYYMERLSNGLGEIPILDVDVVQQGYQPDISYYNGIQFPVRPNHFHLNQPEFVEVLAKIVEYEHRVREAIDQGYIINKIGERVNIKTSEMIDTLGQLIMANDNSPNPQYYKDFISMWYKVLGNSVWYKKQYYKDVIPMVVPSVLEHYQTALRDPAFYMIWKRVLGLFSDWQKKLPLYKVEELKVPSVEIRSVEVDKLVTYFEHSYYNVSNHLYMNEHESKAVVDEVSVLVQRPQLNHKVFTFRVNVSSEVAKPVVVKFFLAPKYDSKGYEIPLHENYENFFLFDQFVYDLPAGECVIKRESTENSFTFNSWTSGYEVYEKAYNALNNKGEFAYTTCQIDRFPDHLLLPKGRVGGMSFKVLVHISAYRPDEIPHQSSDDPIVSWGTGFEVRWLNEKPFKYPLDRPLYQWQVDLTPNMYIQEVQIVHKQAPEVGVF